MTDTIDMANAAEAAYQELKHASDEARRIAEQLDAYGSPCDAWYAEMDELAIDLDIAAGMLSMVIHPQIEIDEDEL